MENLIALTPTQHYTYAHPNNNTQYIDRVYQYVCLVSKTGTIRDNLLQKNKEPIIYDFYLYQTVLNIGLGTEEFYEVQEMDFGDVLNRLEQYYWRKKEKIWANESRICTGARSRIFTYGGRRIPIRDPKQLWGI